ncbi:MAG: class I tRNA ligase family protein, partial [Desulfotomaculales bacterium]
QLGADILRLWVSSADYRSDMALSDGILRQLTDAYRKIRNTCRFLLGNLYDFDPARDRVPYRQLPEIDRWALLRLARMTERVLSAYKNYDYHIVQHAIHNFCAVDMSALYLDMTKDRLYTSAARSPERRAAQTVLYQVLVDLVRLLAPVLAFTSEEIWKYLPKEEGAPVSVQLTDLPAVNEEYLDADLENRWERLLAVRSVVTRALEEARKEKSIGNSLEAAVDLYVNSDLYELLKGTRDILPVFFIVSAVAVHKSGEKPAVDAALKVISGGEIAELTVAVRRAPGEKCARCWKYSEGVGTNEEHPALCPRCAETVEAVN